MSRLITPSLFSSIKWFKDAPYTWQEKAETDLTNTLSRIWTDLDPNGPAQRGIDFENHVYRLLEKGTAYNKINASPHFFKVMDACKGGVFQKKAKKYLTIDGEEYCIYSKLDVWFPKSIIDIKTTGARKYKSGKYLKTTQHRIYCYTCDITNFQYVIALFNEDNTIADVVFENYKSQGIDKEEEYIIELIKDLLDFMDNYPSFKEMWLEKYSLY